MVRKEMDQGNEGERKPLTPKKSGIYRKEDVYAHREEGKNTYVMCICKYTDVYMQSIIIKRARERRWKKKVTNGNG